MHYLSIILVCPQLAENIGSVARSMSNFALYDLRIVSPRNGWPPSKEAFATATKASDILNKAKIFHNLNDAILDLNFIIAATARSRHMVKKSISPKKIVEHCNKRFSKDTRIGILFGRENNGLSNEELSLAEVISIIPTDQGNSSLNLAQAVTIFAYEFFLYGKIKNSQNINLCNKEEFNNLFDLLISSLESRDYFKEDNTKGSIIYNIRNTFLKSLLTSQEIRAFIGIIKNLTKYKELL